jgi:hypothetical protein
MNAIDGVDPSASAASQSVQAAQANSAVGGTLEQAQKAGLPPVGLAQAASANTVNAELVASQWGIDPGSVAGAFGYTGQPGALFAGETLLPVLSHLTRANAEQALSLLGVQTPTHGGSGGTSAARSPNSTAQSISTAGQAALSEAAYSASGPQIVDPLWGRDA